MILLNMFNQIFTINLFMCIINTCEGSAFSPWGFFPGRAGFSGTVFVVIHLIEHIMARSVKGLVCMLLLYITFIVTVLPVYSAL